MKTDDLGQPRQDGIRIEQADPMEWDGLVECFPDRTVFHRMAWLRAIEQAYKLKLVLLRASQSGICVALWPVLTLRKGPFLVAASPLPGWATVYLGPLFQPDADGMRILGRFMATPPLLRAAYTYCKLNGTDPAIDLSSFGFHRRGEYRTYRLQLAPDEDSLWANLETRCRNMVRKARKAGLVCKCETTPGFVNDFWDMSLEVFSKSGTSPTFNRPLVETMSRNLLADGCLLAISIFSDSKRLATALLPHDDQTIYYWAGASRMASRGASPNNLLLWEAIREARRRGLRVFDFVSIYGGPGKFKRSFGGTETVTATHWERSRSRLIGWLKTVYERRLRARRRSRHE